ncbi:MAG: bifunctional demethylmenaquinone methyltransferase/2-methoxy-6-polyprenyl-1,4-benzoquinol methylase [Rhodoferax ferrireducens]|uniref:Ubiquinone/menaquinone biosynthesis C-methyltransferase UbiE n=1 Tax=Rhodoferax ferrireducens TaxID=192843 RepID=A0A1W9KV50_9BURK|nr:MAG: bifunctional demethylmenaquinone methyltransferase/2-methoxy-6-polyprenyl-1,4-benzoquinol methylase [Rhodoferax ferrireducens]
MTQPDDINHSFGRESVNQSERRARIRTVFTAVAPRYDLMNDLMSMGIHRLWKLKLARRVTGINGRVIDLAGGTGDVARLLRNPQRQVTVCDPSLAMMQVGQQRPDMTGIDWLVGEAEQLPLPDASVDLLTVSFGLRNATHLEKALTEIHRVLKPGGSFVCLEFSQPAFWLAPFYNLYSFLVIPRLGALVAREPIAYQYLVESIRRFPDQTGFAKLMTDAGFQDIRWENLSFGIACLHFGTRGNGG